MGREPASFAFPFVAPGAKRCGFMPAKPFAGVAAFLQRFNETNAALVVRPIGGVAVINKIFEAATVKMFGDKLRGVGVNLFDGTPTFLRTEERAAMRTRLISRPAAPPGTSAQWL